MAITVVCPALTWYDAGSGTYQRCGQAWDVPDDQAGRTAACPVCGSAVPVPRPVPNLEEIARRRDEDLDVLPFPPDDEPTRPSPPATQPRVKPAPPAASRPATPRPATSRPATAPGAVTPTGPAASSKPSRSATPVGRPRDSAPSAPAAPPASAARPASRPKDDRATPVAAIPVAPSAPGGVDDFYGDSDNPQADFALAPATERPRAGDPLFADLPPLPVQGPAFGAQPPTSSAGRNLATAEQTLVQASGPPTVHRCPKCGAPVHELLCTSCGYHQGLKRQVSDFTPQDAQTRGFMRTMESHVQGLPPRAVLAWTAATGLIFALVLAYMLWLMSAWTFVVTLPAVAGLYFVLFVSGLRRGDGSKAFDAWTATLMIQRMLGWRSGTQGQPVVAVARRGRSFTDADLDDLEQWYDVETLDLQGTSVTDRGLASLVAMPRLTYLVVRDTPVTERAVLGFQRRRPTVWVWR